MRPGICCALSLLIVFAGSMLAGCTSALGDADDDTQLADDAEVANESTSDAITLPLSDGGVLPVLGMDETAPYPLNQVVDIDLKDVSLQEVADWIHERFDVPVVIDIRDDGFASHEQARFNVQARDQHLYTVLKRSLIYKVDREWLQVETIVHEGSLILGLYSGAYQGYRIVNYDIADLLDRGLDVEVLKQLLFKFTDGTWRGIEVQNGAIGGGGGTIDHFRGTFIIQQVPLVHQQIDNLLAVLRHPRVPVLRLQMLEDDRQNELRLKESITLSLTDVPFEEAIRQFSEVSGVPMRISASEIAEEGYKVDTPVSMSADNIAAESALDTLLSFGADSTGLRWLTYDGEVVITTIGCGLQFMRLYDVSDFVKTEEEQIAFNRLLEACTAGLWTDSRYRSGEYILLEPGWMLFRDEDFVFSQTDEVLAVWRSLGLNDPDRSRFPLDETPSTSEIVTTESFLMHADTAADLLSILPTRVVPGTWQDAEHPDAVGKISMVRLGMAEYTPPEPPIDPRNRRPTVDATTTDATEPEPPAETIEFPAALLIIQHEQSAVMRAAIELRFFSPDSWTTPPEGIRNLIPIQQIDSQIGADNRGGFF